MLQRILITLYRIRKYQRHTRYNDTWKTEYLKFQTAIRRLLKYHALLVTSLTKTQQLCNEIAEDRRNHIQAIEHARQQRFFDNMNEFQSAAIESQGKREYHEFLSLIKSIILMLKTIRHEEWRQAKNH
jgi:SRSO17 transposase